MDIVTIDFETYYDKDYSLSKMTTEAYVRSHNFEVIGVGIKVNNYPTDWYSGDNPGKFLNSLDYRDKAILCHNTAFDGAILSWHFGIRPKLWLDTLSMARPFHQMTVGGSLAALATYYGLGAKGDEVVNALGKERKDFSPDELARYAEYCKNDVEITKKLFDKLSKGFPISEIMVIDQILRMYTEPTIELDVILLQTHLQEVLTRKRTLINDLGLSGISDEAINKMLMSNDIFAKYLKNLGIDPPTKVSPTTGKQTWAFAKTDKAMTELLEHPDERVQSVVAARLGVKSTLEETRTNALIGVATRGRLPIMLNYYGAHTGRLSGGDKLNLQNLPSRGNTSIKKALKAPEGYTLVSADSSQIEARLVAWLAGQDDLVQAFRENRDVYSEFASEVYGRKITKADKVERFVGKTCIAEGTLVLSDQGWKPIESVTTDDRLWDGEEWVCHQGLLNNGIKPTLNLCGTWLTPDHQVWSGTQWLEAQSVVADEGILYQSLDTAAENLPLQAICLGNDVEYPQLLSDAIVTNRNTPSITRTLKVSEAPGALPVQKKRLLPNGIGLIPKLCQMMNTAQGYLTDWRQQLLGATLIPTGCSSITGGAGYRSAKNGATTAVNSSPMFRPLQIGMSLNMRWIGSTRMGTTNPAISGLYPEVTIFGTKEKSLISKRVYDILNCGSRNRFTILTDAGPLIVHNCVLGLGYGMGAEKFRRTLEIGQAGISVKIDISEAERIVRLYRSKNHKIVGLWNQCGNALTQMLQGGSGSVGALSYDNEGIVLPNKFRIKYPALRQTQNGFEYINDARSYRKAIRERVINGEIEGIAWTRIYGGKVTENIVQALAALVIRDQMVAIGKQYHVVFQVHDEIIITALDAEATVAQAALEKVMFTPPSWAPDLPVACESGFAKNYGDA